jgi:hypothetical protein
MRYLTLVEVARRLRISFSSALELVRSHRLPAKLDRNTGRWYVREDFLKTYQESKRHVA